MAIDTASKEFACPPDRELPFLQQAFDLEVMLRHFRQHLQSKSATEQIRGIELSRIRYREGRRAVFQYTLDLLDQRTGKSRTVIVTATMYADKDAAKAARKLRKTAPAIQQLRAFEPACYISETDMLVQVFPIDRRLAPLANIASAVPSQLETAIKSELPSKFWTIDDCHFETVRYRSGLSAVLRYDVSLKNNENGRRSHKTYYAKVYRTAEQVEHAFQMLNELRTPKSFPVGVSRPLCVVPELQTLVLEATSGRTLEDIARGENANECLRQTAEAMASFNQSESPANRQHRAADQTSNLQRAARKLIWACPHLEKRIDRIVARVSELPDAPLGPTHRDLKLEHIFFDRDQVSFIDWDSYASADPVLDPAMLMARFVAITPNFNLPYDYFRSDMATFVQHYFARTPTAWRERLPLHYAGAALEVAVGFFGRQEPSWAETILALVEEAEATLGGRREW